NYPDITRLYSIGQSYENRSIWCLEISDNPGVDEGEPGVFFMGLHHAREWPSLEICLHIAQTLTTSYIFNASIGDLVDNRRIWIVPCVNPDGYHYDHDQGNDWRKNRHYFPESDTYGVDLNRNYAGACNGDPWGAWGSLGDASLTHFPAYSVYCGPAPFSELETQAIRNMFLENSIAAAISWHTYGELILWPWGYSGDVQAPDSDYLTHIGESMAALMTSQDGSGTYTPTQAAGLYPTTGDTVDWAYGHAHYVQGTTTFTYTIEACQEFHPPASTLEQVVAENFEGAMLLLEEAASISNVTARVLPPRIADMSTDPDGAYTVVWEEQNPTAQASRFQLDELQGLSYDIDHAEDDHTGWTYDGFAATTAACHAGERSYGPRNEDSDVSTMTTAMPIPVVEGLQLSFWCFYDIEENWDYACVEVSRDGRCYDVIDGFTGNSNGWQYQEYDLDEYAGESIFLRFRYTTDGRTLGDGFYVDDISPLATYEEITTLSDDITASHYDVTGRSEGAYYYRVQGYNDARGWGDFSPLKQMLVSETDNSPPGAPSIEGPGRGEAGEEYTYTFQATDAESDDIFYYIDWGDGSDSGWQGPYQSGEPLTLSHTWTEQGSFAIRAKTKDAGGIQSPWESLQISMPLEHQTLLEKIIIWLATMLHSLR
ncbi:MAG: M14 family zinc carboxypeptidase, partial [Thermoplasmatota archaeon]